MTRGPVMVEAREVARHFGRRQVLRGVTLSARAGEMIGIVGENGSGKSTLLRVIAGLLPPTRGHVVVRGRLGYCPQEPQVHASLTVAENLQWFRAAYRLPDLRPAAELLEQLGLGRVLHLPVRQLSGGTLQKLNLLVALLHAPDVLLLDEPYQGFDWEAYLRFWDLAERFTAAGCLVVVVSHLVYERHRFHRLLRLTEGVLVPEGPP